MKPEIAADHVTWQLASDVKAWVKELPLQAAAAISEYLADQSDAWSANSLRVPAQVVASWSATVSGQLELPPNCPLAFDVRLSGAMGKPGAQIIVRWLQPGMTITARDTTVGGLWLTYQGKNFRINSPIYDVLKLIDRFNRLQEGTIDEQFRLWACIREALGDTGTAQLTDSFLRSFRVITASALTFSIRTDARGEVQLDPVLLSDAKNEFTEASSPQVRALSEVDEALFPKRLDQLRDGVSAFPLSQGTYVVADEPLQRALSAVRKLRQAPAAQRKRAAMYPEAVIREMMGADDSEPTVFIETEKFAERVLDVGEWVAPILPWIKISPQNWGSPQSAGIRVGGVEFPLDASTVAQAVANIQSAIAQGLPTVNVAGQELPATPANASALKQLHTAMTREPRQAGMSEEDASAIKSVLIIETNFDETSFTRTSKGSRPGVLGLPYGLKTAPKKHQESGLSWLQKHWVEGSRGALLCDDMGLGKTFQALSFCLWLREMMESGVVEKKPILLIAPVGLLRNWEAEIEDHLFPPGLGNLLRAYGDHLKGLRRGRHVDGTSGLDTAKLSIADVVLANYEAVSDYQLSFGAVPFAAVVMDEAQKIKSPKARMTHAVKGLNTEFTLAMTGTPVENRLADLWCIADAVQPGALSDLKEFSSLYEVEGSDVSSLRQKIWQEEDAAGAALPKLLLRRLKSEKLDGLPAKHEHLIKVPMPPRQADAYQRALAMKEIAGPDGTLGMIHALRRASLHPSLIEGGVQASELRVEDSARFIATIDVLDAIAIKGEKALVFLESLDLQEADQLPLLLQRRYNLDKAPMVINGQVSTEARQSRVNIFQREPGFDVMLLSPKAGGVGLTLTAANHVIHLSRWWNPAVEDQCSDRVYRIGQTKPVHIYYPLAVLPDNADSSFDVQLQVLMDRKRKLALNLLAAPAFTKDDYDNLILGIKKKS